MEGHYTKENGNIVINYDRVKIKDKVWLFLIPECLIGAFCYWIFPNNISYFLILFFVLGFPTLAILWSTCVDGGNKKIEKKLSFECLNSIIDKDIKGSKGRVDEILEELKNVEDFDEEE